MSVTCMSRAQRGVGIGDSDFVCLKWWEMINSQRQCVGGKRKGPDPRNNNIEGLGAGGALSN